MGLIERVEKAVPGMDAKGTLLISCQEYVLAYFGGEGFVKWLTTLQPEVAEAYRSKIPSSDWFPLTRFVTIPTIKICELFFDGDSRGAWEVGRYAADLASNRFLRLFVRIASTYLLLQRAGDILSMYYRPSTHQLIRGEANHARLEIHKFIDIHDVIEQRIGGWIERAVEISTGNEVKVEIISSLTKGDAKTVFDISWK